MRPACCVHPVASRGSACATGLIRAAHHGTSTLAVLLPRPPGRHVRRMMVGPVPGGTAAGDQPSTPPDAPAVAPPQPPIAPADAAPAPTGGSDGATDRSERTASDAASAAAFMPGDADSGHSRTSSDAGAGAAAGKHSSIGGLLAPFQADKLNGEIISIAFPMLFTLAADPIAGLVDTAYIGRLGAAELAGTGVALSMFNVVTKLFNMPLISVTTSSVATAKGSALAAGGSTSGGDAGASNEQDVSAAVSAAVSSAMVIALMVGLVQTLLLLASARWGTGAWGAPPGSPLHRHVLDFLVVRALGAPATVLLLVQQGVYRGLQDTRTPLWATLGSNVLNVVLNTSFVVGAGWGVRGAALGTVIAQVVPCLLLLRMLSSKYRISLSESATLQQVIKLFGPTGFLALRTGAITAVYACATSLAARAGPSAAACHQICFQVWLASSLLADSLAVAGQTLLARSIAARDMQYAQQVVGRVVGMAGALGLVLTALMAAASPQLPGMFTSDAGVLALMQFALPFVVATQAINALAFAWDGVLYGAGGFKFASVQMAVCAMPAIATMVLGTLVAGPGATAAAKLQCIWAGLALVMGLRALTIWAPHRLGAGPFKVLAVGGTKLA